MIAWSPYPNFAVSAHVLSATHLGRQLGDCTTMISILSGALPGGTHRYDRSLDMWRGKERSLCTYTDAIVRELRRRGYYEDLKSPLEDADLWQIPKDWLEQKNTMPPWVGEESLHASHRATLLSEDMEWYAQMAWMEPARREVRYPMPMPVPGDTVLHADGRVGMVICRRGPDMHVRLQSGGSMLTVPEGEFASGQWRRCVRAD